MYKENKILAAVSSGLISRMTETTYIQKRRNLFICGSWSSIGRDILLHLCRTNYPRSHCYVDLDSLITISHPEVIPCCDQFPMIVETRKHVLVTINRRVTQIAKPIPIYEKVSKVAEEQIITLYTTNELQLWEDYNNFPSYIKSSHQKILNSLCIMEEYSSCMSNMLGRVFNMEGILGDVQTRGIKLVNDINPLGFVSREFNLIKEFILISMALEDLALIISCVVKILMFSLPPSIAALIKRIVLDWIGHYSENSWDIDSLWERVQV